ncbi:MAG: hypothetical protein L0271_08565 [Gemmatimonadetes bacterium]|nr:hypothetical protein [Gemmatimonadota bacterium]
MTSTLRAPAETKPGSAATFLFRSESFIARSDCIAACQAAIREMASWTHCHEAGTALFASFQDATDPGSFLIVTVFADARAEHAHRTSSAHLAFEQTLLSLTVAGTRTQAWIPGPGL